MIANSAFLAKYGAMCTVVTIVGPKCTLFQIWMKVQHVWPLVTIEILYIVHIVPYDVFEANFSTVDQNRATTTL